MQNDSSPRFLNFVQSLVQHGLVVLGGKRDATKFTENSIFVHRKMTAPAYADAIVRLKFPLTEIPQKTHGKLLPPMMTKPMAKEIAALMANEAVRWIVTPFKIVIEKPAAGSHCGLFAYHKATGRVEIWDDRFATVMTVFNYEEVISDLKEWIALLYPAMGLAVNSLADVKIIKVRQPQYVKVYELLKSNGLPHDFQAVYSSYLVNWIDIVASDIPNPNKEFNGRLAHASNGATANTAWIDVFRSLLEHTERWPGAAEEHIIPHPCPPGEYRSPLTEECEPVNAEIAIPVNFIRRKHFLPELLSRYMTYVLQHLSAKYPNMKTIFPIHKMDPHPYYFAIQWTYVGGHGRKRWTLTMPLDQKPNRAGLTQLDLLLDRTFEDDRYRFICFMVFIKGMRSGYNHSNTIIIDKTNRTVERYEPNSGYTNLHHQVGVNNGPALDDALRDTFETRFSRFGLKYIDAVDVCPYGMHRKECDEPGCLVKDFGGNCGQWSVWYMDTRLANPDVPRQKLWEYARHEIQRFGSFKHFISGYHDDLIVQATKFRGSKLQSNHPPRLLRKAQEPESATSSESSYHSSTSSKTSNGRFS